jgi:hypothetical protein
MIMNSNSLESDFADKKLLQPQTETPILIIIIRFFEYWNNGASLDHFQLLPSPLPQLLQTS